jgi:hypothetical protein
MPFRNGDDPLQVSFEQIVKQRSDCQREINSLLQRQPQYVGQGNQVLVYLLFLVFWLVTTPHLMGAKRARYCRQPIDNRWDYVIGLFLSKETCASRANEFASGWQLADGRGE